MPTSPSKYAENQFNSATADSITLMSEILADTLRLTAAAELYSYIAVGMSFYKTNPSQVDTLFTIGLLRSPAQQIPAPPATTLWNPATRTLSVTALPTGATRLEAWRVGPGGMPEQLAIGLPGQTTVLIPATITFTPGSLYQLWLQARDSKGTSAPGPVQNWTAV